MVFVLQAMSSLFEVYENKKLPNVTETISDVPRLSCLATCMRTNGCFAVNFDYHRNTVCELTGGLRTQEEMLDETNSSLLVMSKYRLCKEFNDYDSELKHYRWRFLNAFCYLEFYLFMYNHFEIVIGQFEGNVPEDFNMGSGNAKPIELEVKSFQRYIE